jgi:cystathionine gamma-lyase
MLTALVTVGLAFGAGPPRRHTRAPSSLGFAAPSWRSHPAWRRRLSGGAPVAAASTHQSDAERADAILRDARVRLRPQFEAIDDLTQRNLRRILKAFRNHRVGPHCFGGVDGYGHGDIGRETIDAVFAELFGAESAWCRVQCMSGTHAIACALFGCLRPGDTMLAVSGAPYDTLDEVIGTRPPSEDVESAESGEAASSEHGGRPLVGSLAEWGVSYSQVNLTSTTDEFNLDAIDAAIANDSSITLLHVQRSCGYAWRRSLPIGEIRRLCSHVRARWIDSGARPSLVIFVDNCYGEFVQDVEPTHPSVGADLCAGSLIKSPGGTLAPAGGYVAGRAPLVRAAARRLAAPGVAGSAALGQWRLIYQGLFLAPTVIGETLKGCALLAETLGSPPLSLSCNPPPGLSLSERTDVIQAVALGSPRRLVRFCEEVQKLSPVSSYARPVPGITAGYSDETIFADGTFVEGSTGELSADGPLRPPYAVYAQGGTHWTHWALILEEVLPFFLGEGEGAASDDQSNAVISKAL